MTMLSNLAPIPELYVSYESAQTLKVEAGELTSHDLSPRQICDLELLMNGGFNPLKGFLSEDDYNGVVDGMRLTTGELWPMPITLDVSEDFAASIVIGQDIALRDQEGVILGTMTITDRWEPNKAKEAEKVYGTDDDAHPAVNYLHNQAGKIYLGGPVQASSNPSTMISVQSATHRTSCVPISAKWAGAKLWRSKPATHCTVHTKN